MRHDAPRTSTRKLRRTPRPLVAGLALLVGAAVAAPLVGLAGANAAPAPVGAKASSATTSLWTPAALAKPRPKLGGWSKDMPWYDANVGKAQIYRAYDPGFHPATWQQSYWYKTHPGVTTDLSLGIPPAALAAGQYDARLKAFIATSPKDVFITNWHEPEDQIEAGTFTAAQYRAAIARLAQIVHAQNAVDGGQRKVTTILMAYTLRGWQGRDVRNYWPGNDASGRPYVDVVSFDAYQMPHATDTPGVPVGHTDGVNWQSSAQLLDPVISYAASIKRPWMISEFGFLEDIHDATHKARSIIDYVNYARAHGALAVEYWNSVGRRADWRLGFNPAATTAWKSIVQAP